jgi:tRNA A37 N6-isopentenylltransferase MiaA
MRIIGVDKDSIFQAMDAITNAISDSCFPEVPRNYIEDAHNSLKIQAFSSCICTDIDIKYI